MKYLLDTSVISAIGPTARREPKIEDWVATHSDDLFLSVISVTEIRSGISKAERKGASQKAAALLEWWEAVESLYADRIVPFDIEAARCAGALSDRLRSLGHEPDFADVAIAAIAHVRGQTVVTRNTRHFSPITVRLFNPFTL